MPHTFQTFERHIQNLQREDWNKLFDLLPEMKLTGLPASLSSDLRISKTVHFLSQGFHNECLSRIVQALFELDLIIDFDWIHWEEAEMYFGNPTIRLEKLDVFTLCKLLTAIIRKDQIMEGSLVQFCEDGTVQRILFSLRKKVMESRKGLA